MSYVTSTWYDYRHARARTHTHIRACVLQKYSPTHAYTKNKQLLFREEIWEYLLKRYGPFVITCFQNPPFIDYRRVIYMDQRIPLWTPRSFLRLATRDALLVCRLIYAVQFIFSQLIGLNSVKLFVCLPLKFPLQTPPPPS
jgi:hypothetical protein